MTQKNLKASSTLNLRSFKYYLALLHGSIQKEIDAETKAITMISRGLVIPVQYASSK